MSEARLGAERALREVSKILGGMVGAGAGGPEELLLTATLDGVEVKASIAPGKGKGVVDVEAPALDAAGLELELYPEGFTQQLAKMFGAQDILVGESRFDDRYMIKASDEALAKLWLSHDLRKLIRAAHPDEAEGAFLVELARGRARITWAPTTQSAARIESAMRAVATLAGRPRALCEELRRLAEQLGGALEAPDGRWRPGGGVAILVEQAGRHVRLDHQLLALEGGRPEIYLKVTTKADRAGRLFICRPNAHRRAERLLGVSVPELPTHDRDLGFHFTIGAEPAGLMSGRLRGEERAALLEAMPTAVTLTEDRVDLYLEGFAPSLRRLQRACELALALAGEPAARALDDGVPRQVTEAPRRGRRRAGESARRITQMEAQPAPDSLGGTLRLTGLADAGDFNDLASLFRVTIDGDEIVAEETWSAIQEGVQVLSMRAQAHNASGLYLRVVEGDLDPISTILGVQDIEIGEKPFDDRFIIKTNDPGYAALWLGREVRELLLGLRDVNVPVGYAIALNEGGLTLTRGQVERDPYRLERAFRAVAAICRRSTSIAQECRALAAALDAEILGAATAWDPETGITMSIGRGESAVTIGQRLSSAFTRKPLLYTTIRKPRLDASGGRFVVAKHELKKRAAKLLGGKLAAFKSEDGHFNFLYWVGCEDASVLGERLDEQMISRLVLSEPEVMIVSEREITLWFAGFVADAERLGRALKALGELSGSADLMGPAGPYR